MSGQLFAIKIFKLDDPLNDEAAIRCLHREVDSTQKLNQKNIVQVYEFFENIERKHTGGKTS